MEFINNLTDERFLDDHDSALFAHVVGHSLSELKGELRKQSAAFLGQVYSNEKFITSELNSLGLHIYRILLAHQIHEKRNPVLDGAADSYSRNGYVKINNFLPLDEFRGLRERFEKETHYNPSMKINFNDSSFFLRYPEFIVLIKKCCHIRSLSADAPAGVPRSQFWNLQHDGTDPQYRFHTDTFHPVCKMWLYLGDIDKESGPLTLVKGSHQPTLHRLRWELETSLMLPGSDLWHTRVQKGGRPGPFRILEGSTEEEELQELERIGYNDIVRLTGAANTLIIANTRGFHKRGEACPGTPRQQLTVQYRSKAFGVY